MGKTRLYKDDRSAIRVALVKHKIDPITAAHDQAGYVLADELWEKLHGEHKKLIEKLPAGALPEDDNLTVRAYGKYVTLPFGAGSWNERPKRRIFSAHDRLVEMLPGDLAQRIEAWAVAGEDIKKCRNDLANQIDATLNGFRSFDDLLAAWPDAEAFITKRWRERPEYAQATLPAVVLTDLSKALDLPPEVQEAA